MASLAIRWLDVSGLVNIRPRPEITKDYLTLPKVTFFAGTNGGSDIRASAVGRVNGCTEATDAGATFTFSLPFLYQKKFFGW
jgi:hypothetical protein